MTSSSESTAETLKSISRKISQICSSGAEESPWGPPRAFSGFAKRLQLVVSQMSRSQISSPAIHTAFRGVSVELVEAAGNLSAYSRSRIYVLINCNPLCSSLRDRAIAIGQWLALLDDPLSLLPDLRKRASDLSRDMQQCDLRVTENEERVYRTLQREAEVRQINKAVQSAIIMDLARALGTDPSDHRQLADQIKLLKSDLSGSSSASERRILISLEKIFDSWASSMGPGFVDTAKDSGFENDDDESHIPPFKNFLCPLTKEVMKDPVVLESSQTYERSAIQYWFDRCLEDGRDPTCPVTGEVLRVLALKPNIGLAGAIDEWVNRNVEVQVRSAVRYLTSDGDECSMECVGRALDNVSKISEEYPLSRYRVRNAGIVGLVVRMLKDQSKKLGSQMRSKALTAMLSMAKDEESKLIMLEEGITRLAIRSLTVSSEKEREIALRLLLEFSCDKEYCTKIATEKGALVLLSSMAGNMEHPTSTNLAEEILKNMEMVEGNIHHLAIAGRYQPLLKRLWDGTEDSKLEIATLVGNMNLTNDGKDYIARKGGKVLIGMLSSNLVGRASSLQALYNLSTLEDNASTLVDLNILPALTNILFERKQDGSSDLEDLAAKTIANIVSNSGHWELSLADTKGHPMQSEFIVYKLLELLSNSACNCQTAILHILCGIASSPQASDLIATHIRSGNGIATILLYLAHPETDRRKYAFKLTRLLSQRLGQALVDELRATKMLSLLKKSLLDTQTPVRERSEITCILANLPFSDDEVKTILGSDLLKWTVTNLKEQQSSSSGNNSRNARGLVEGLLGLLLHYAKCEDPTILLLVQENHFMTIFRDQLSILSHHRAKQRAALGLKYLSQSARLSALRDRDSQLHGFCVPFGLICGRTPTGPLCPLHNSPCDDDSSFCLLKGKAIKPLIDSMSDENVDVQIAVVEALSTIFSDAGGLEKATKELEQLGLFDAAIHLLKEVRPGELQERVISMVERFLRIENLVQEYSTDLNLTRALIEALKHGNSCTKSHAQDALTSLRELSGVGGKRPNQSSGRGTTR